MTTQAGPEPSALHSWDEAFQYPLPTVRKLSMRLRRDIDEHKGRLRSLVGTSYRDLLGTAERIVDMDKQIQSVEESLGDIGRRCNSDIIERGHVNFVRLERGWSSRGHESTKLKSAALTRVLSATLSVVGRLIKKRGEALQAAKLMVLARLVYKSLSEDDGVASVEKYRRTIASLRTRLLAYIDRLLGRSNASADEISATLSAYALLTSSSTRDVLRHFLTVRSAQLEEMTSKPSTGAILNAIKMHSSTFVSVQAVFPNHMAETLRTLGRVPLLSDKHIKSIDDLGLDVYGRWIPENIRTFMPWIQQDSLSAGDAREAVLGYDKQARSTLLSSTRSCLDQSSDAGEIINMRKQVLSAYLGLGRRIRITGLIEHIDGLREVFVARLERIAEQVAQLSSFTAEDMQKHCNAGNKHGSVWDLARDDVDLSSGAINFRKSIMRCRHGRDGDFDLAVEPLSQWVAGVEALNQNIEEMRATKWDQYVENYMDDIDEEEQGPFQQLLSTDDPNRLTVRLRSCMDEAISRAFDNIRQAIPSQRDSGQKQAYFLRLLREMNRQQRNISHLTSATVVDSSSHHKLSETLHTQLANSIVADHVEKYGKKMGSKQQIAHDLWEESTKLPLQPMPTTFSLIMSIQRAMKDVGEDVWSPAAVSVLKRLMEPLLAQALDSPIERPPEKPHVNGGDAQHEVDGDQPSQDMSADDEARHENGVNGEEDAGNAEIGTNEARDGGADDAREDDSKDADATTGDARLQYTQRLFDACYLAQIFRTVSDTDGRLGETIKVLQQRCGLAESEGKRVDKHAREYWRKTYLLFGLLAPR